LEIVKKTIGVVNVMAGFPVANRDASPASQALGTVGPDLNPIVAIKVGNVGRVDGADSDAFVATNASMDVGFD
jgi:hypothetical protein